MAVGGRDILRLVEYSPDNMKTLKNLKNKSTPRFNTTYIDWNPKNNNMIAAASLMGAFYVMDL